MKKAITTGLLSILFLLTSCLKDNHSIRLKNDYPSQINKVVIGNAQIGDVASGTTSDYQPINTGNFSISGTTNSGQSLSGSGSVSGKGRHKWTITVSGGGQISFTEDK